MPVTSGQAKLKDFVNSADQRAASFVNEMVAAEVLDLSPRTMRQLRWRGGGPRFYKLGNRVKYLIADLHAWAASRACENTAQATALPRASDASTPVAVN